jgi:sialate O-acetylesterase
MRRLILFLAVAFLAALPLCLTAADKGAKDKSGATQPDERKLKLAAPFGDRMVLQRDMPVPVWGNATPGSTVSVEFGGHTQSATADANGDWMVKLDPMPASEKNRTMTVRCGGAKTEFKEILVGEVWFCSGQSNMALGVNGTTEKDNVKDASDPLLRLRFVANTMSAVPLTELSGSDWRLCTPQALGQGSHETGFSAVAYCFGKHLRKKLNVPIGLIQSAWGGTRIEPWIPPSGFRNQPKLKDISDFLTKADTDYRNAFKKNIDAVAAWEKTARAALTADTPLPPPLPDVSHPIKEHQQPTALFNSMVNPWIPYAIRGAIWYQGESNRGEGMLYCDKMKALVGGWRQVWNQGDFPFYFVQLAPYNYGNNPEALPEIWEAQYEAAAQIPNTGMAIINDVGNITNIHPTDKNTVGQRLARLALSRTYGVKFTDDCGPVFKTMSIDGDKIKVTFDYAKSGLASRDGKPLSSFEIAGADGRFMPAEATIAGSTVIIRNNKIAQPKAVRFAWNHIAVPNLMNKDGLPASAFRAPKKINTRPP